MVRSGSPICIFCSFLFLETVSSSATAEQ
jgi:hypothetical protein